MEIQANFGKEHGEVFGEEAGRETIMGVPTKAHGGCETEMWRK